jgi:ABC-type branched-subunit amino acid transport system ATPase component/branched-subunit amino acid ABC-type transport system permease component
LAEFLPFIVIGLSVGSIYGLAATGLVLTYKTSGIFNFAYGALASVSVFIFYELHDVQGWPWPLAGGLCVFVVGPVMGYLLELLARQLAAADRTLQIGAMVGLIVCIVSITGLLFSNTSGVFPSFLPTATVRLLDVNVEWEQIIVFIVGLAAAGGLYAFLRFTRRGVELRAVVDDPDLLSVTGTSAVRVRRLAWMIGSSFAALSGLLIAPNLQLSATALTLLVVQAFCAAAIGYFSNLPLTYLGGLLTGVAGAVATKYVVNVPWLIGFPSSLPFVVLFVVLLVTPRGRLLVRSFVVPRRIPPSWHAPLRARLLSGVVFLALLCAVPWLVGTNLASYTSALILVILLLSLGLLLRTARQVSLCQYGFAAIGAAAMAHFTGAGIPWLIALLLAALVAIPVGALIAIPAIRLSGVFLALATLGFGILLEQMVYTQGWMFGASSNGLPTTRPDLSIDGFQLGSDEGMYFVVLAFVAVVAVAIAVLTETRLGKLLRAMGDSPVALDTYGVNVNVIRVLVFCVSAAIAAIAGALTASVDTYAIGDNFPSFSSLTIVTIVLVVVVGDPWYAFIAAAGLTIIPVYLTGGNVTNVILAVAAIGSVLVPVFRHRLQATPPRAVQAFADWIGGRPTRASGAPPATAPPAAPRPAPQPEPANTPTPALAPVHLASPPARLASPPAHVGSPRARLASRKVPSAGLAVENLTIRYGGALAVDSASLTVQPGAITGLVGPNGAGKTSIFNACSGLIAPTGGRITLHGDDISHASPSQRARLGLGRTFQRVQLFESLPVRSNVQLARESALAGSNPLRQVVGRRSDAREIERATTEAIKLTGIGPYVDAPVDRLSTGQRRLVELARVLAGPFDIILLDEPSSGLDPTETKHFGQILCRAVAERGLGVLLVEHDMALVQQTCAHVYVLDYGTMIFEGTAQQMLTADSVRAAYLGVSTTETAS